MAPSLVSGGPASEPQAKARTDTVARRQNHLENAMSNRTTEHSEPQEELFASTGLPGQEFVLPATPYLDGSAVITAATATPQFTPESRDSRRWS